MNESALILFFFILAPLANNTYIYRLLLIRLDIYHFSELIRVNDFNCICSA